MKVTMRDIIARRKALPESDGNGFELDDRASDENPKGPRRGILVRVSLETWSSLRLMAAEKDRSVQSMLEGAIVELLTNHGGGSRRPARCPKSISDFG